MDDFSNSGSPGAAPDPRSYEAQKQRLERWHAIFSNYLDVIFLTKVEFELAMQPYLVQGVFLGQEWFIPGTMQQVRARVSVAPEYCPLDAGDAAGPFEMWYGSVQGHPFCLQYDYGAPQVFLNGGHTKILIGRSIGDRTVEALVKSALTDFLEYEPDCD